MVVLTEMIDSLGLHYSWGYIWDFWWLVLMIDFIVLSLFHFPWQLQSPIDKKKIHCLVKLLMLSIAWIWRIQI
uniref:Uncharacterized protein n=1 Tax=Rhizophora mucronata TaxID=61149 RepID=A0A2P2N7D6_RHIMU